MTIPFAWEIFFAARVGLFFCFCPFFYLKNYAHRKQKSRHLLQKNWFLAGGKSYYDSFSFGEDTFEIGDVVMLHADVDHDSDDEDYEPPHLCYVTDIYFDEYVWGRALKMRWWLTNVLSTQEGRRGLC